MPQIKIHIATVEAAERLPAMLREVRLAMTGILGIGEEFGQVILYETPPGRRDAHETRDPHFAFIEIIMYPGRSREIRQRLMQELTGIVGSYLRVDLSDINCCIYEVAPENYFGGITHR